MATDARNFWLVPMLGTLAAVLSVNATAFAQGAPLPPSPVPVLPPAGSQPQPPTLGQPQPLTPPPPAPLNPPPPPLSPPPPPSAPPLYQPADPGPNGWGPFQGPSSDPSFLVNLELQVLKPVLRNQLTNTVNMPDGTTIQVAPQGESLNATVSPEIQVGYRMSDSLGDLLLSYRFIVSQGTGTVADDPLGTMLKTRLNINIVDFDYATARYAPVPRWDMQWTIGIRYTSVFFDNDATNEFTDMHASNYFSGAGPHAALEVQRHIDPLPSFAIFAKVDAGVMIGQLTQKYTLTGFDANGNLEQGETDVRHTQSVPMLDARIGLSYSPPQMETLRFSLGYQFEQWWSIGQLGDSRGDLSSHGGFFRAELDF